MGNLLFSGAEDPTRNPNATTTAATMTEPQKTQVASSSYLDGLLAASLSQVWGSEYKMIFVVNMDLNMGRGKQCAQVAHAALGLFLQIQESGEPYAIEQMQQWISMGQKKIVVKGNNLAHMNSLREAANKAGLANHLVSDAGCTQIAPGSKTVLSIFGRNQDLDAITGSLKLL